MLTREVEGATIKCGAYWIGTAFGPLRLRLVSLETPPAPADQRPTSAGFFTQLSVPSSRQIPHSAGSKCHRPQHYTTDPRETVKRVFELTHTDYPDAKPRKIVQLQYLGWQDMNVPDDPRSLLGLIKQVEDAVEETHSARDLSKIENRDHIMNEVDQCTGIAKHALGDSPVLLHCSAGVGRTGGFIAVDSILDAIRREIRAERKPDDMDVDSSDQPPRILTSPAFRLKTPIPLNNGIDIPHRAPMFTTTSDTVLWAQNVKAEIGVADSQQNLQHSNHPVSQPSKSSPSFFLSSESQSSQSHVYENYHRSSSSLDTPVSGTLPPCKVSSTPDHHTDGQRPTMQPFPPSTISRNSETPSRPSSRLLEPCTLTERSRMTQGLNQGLSSDGEPPSRSQSPSADEANTSQTPPSRDSILASSHRLIATSTPFSLIKPFDYKEPRLLHKDVTPPNLTSFEDPIWEVVQDMREQRMSLCQTLRQYVFVHAAIIEGALMVLDDEKMVKNGLAMPVPRTTSPASSLRSVVPSETTSLAASNKRGASPTELLKENKAGDVMLSKRPSMKRKQAKEDDIIANARYRPVVTLTPLRIAGPLHSVGTSAASTRSMPP
jgi:protein tyrosine phosphatase